MEIMTRGDIETAYHSREVYDKEVILKLSIIPEDKRL